MQGRTRPLTFWLLICATGWSGCDDARLAGHFQDDAVDSVPEARAPSAFDGKRTGSIAGRVTWDGAVPVVGLYRAPVSPLSEQAGWPKQLWPNPFAPRVDPCTRGIAGAVVFLRGVDPGPARPWNHSPVTIVMHGCQYHVLQDQREGQIGFVRRGDAVTLVSEDDRFHAVQARGAAFFTLAFPDNGQERARVFDRAGVVELSSNAGQFWMRAHLFVADHPYFACTDAEGRFSLDQVPPGHYELACWMPNWHEASHELDAETALVTRLKYRPTVVKLQDVTVEPGARRAARFSFAPTDFDP